MILKGKFKYKSAHQCAMASEINTMWGGEFKQHKENNINNWIYYILCGTNKTVIFYCIKLDRKYGG